MSYVEHETPDEYESQGKIVYQRFCDLESQWCSDEIKTALFLQLFYGFTAGPRDSNYPLIRIDRKRFIENNRTILPNTELVNETINIGTRFDSLSLERGWDSEPFRDVYEAALYILRESYKDAIYPVSDQSYFHRNYGIYVGVQINSEDNVYRGQSDDEWQMIPTIYRPDSEKASLTEEEFRERVRRVSIVTRLIDERFPGRYKKSERIAIAQHYHDITHVPTWLVDFTTDPLIALFFASSNVRLKPGQLGSITLIDRKIWPFSGNVQVAGVPRINRQKGLFLETTHPDLLDQYEGFKIRFYQHHDLIFEDSNQGVTRNYLLPNEDSFRDFMSSLRIESQPTDKDFFNTPHNVQEMRDKEIIHRPTLSLHSLDSRAYETIIQLWIVDKYPHFNFSEVSAMIRRLASFHDELYRQKKAGNFFINVGFTELSSAVRYLVSKVNTKEKPIWKEMVASYLPRPLHRFRHFPLDRYLLEKKKIDRDPELFAKTYKAIGEMIFEES